MFEGLDSINWGELKHAYGPAEDVPDLIRALVSSDQEVREQTLWALYGNLWHQGTVYEATAYAVPFLAELLDLPDLTGKHEILMYIARLASGSSYIDVHQHLAFAFSDEERASVEFQQELDRELSWVKAAHDAVYEDHPVFLRLLAEGDQPTRSVAAHLFTFFPEHYQSLVPQLKERLQIETDDAVAASLLITLGLLIPSVERETAAFIYPYLGADNGLLVRFAAAKALTFLYKDQTPAEALHILLEILKSSEQVDKDYLRMHWADEDIRASISTAFCFVGAEVAGQFVPLLIEALPTLNFSSAIEVVHALMFLVFGQEPVAEGITVRDLTTQQRMTLQAISDHALETEVTGRISVNGNISLLLGDYGLPSQPNTLRTFLQE